MLLPLPLPPSSVFRVHASRLCFRGLRLLWKEQCAVLSACQDRCLIDHCSCNDKRKWGNYFLTVTTCEATNSWDKNTKSAASRAPLFLLAFTSYLFLLWVLQKVTNLGKTVNMHLHIRNNFIFNWWFGLPLLYIGCLT